MIDIKDFILQLEDTTLSLEEQQAALSIIEQSLVETKQIQEKSLEENSTLIVDAVKIIEDRLDAQFSALKTSEKLRGPQGDQGLKGENGKNGRDGTIGRDGKDGKDGINGVDGEDGRYVTNVEVDIDDTLLVTLSDGSFIKTTKEIKGPKGDVGPQGSKGNPGNGVTTGGNAGQVLTKQSNSDYDTIWTTPTTGTVTSVTGTAPVVSTGGNTPAISMAKATTSVDGYLSATDWTTFNNKQPAGTYVNSVSGTTGRITSTGSTTPVLDLASGIATAGTTGSSTLIPVVTVDTYGRVTSVTTASNPQGTVTSVSGTGTVNGINLSGTVTSSGNLTLGGTLDLSSPPTIGNTAPNTGVFTTLTATGTSQFGTTSANFIQATGAATNVRPLLQVLGSDTNVGMALQSKGTGALNFAAGSNGVNVSNGTTVTAITRTASGSVYTSIPAVAISAPTLSGGVQATASALMQSSTAAITVAGSGYAVNDTLVVSGGTFASNPLTFIVASIGAGGSVASLSGPNSGFFGNYSVLPTSPVATTSSGPGTGCTLTPTWGVSTITITNAGSGYVEQPTVTFSGGGGSGAAYATVGGVTTIRSIGSTLGFFTPYGEQVRITDSAFFTAGPALSIFRDSSNRTQLRAAGNLMLYAQSGGSIGFFTNIGSDVQQFGIAHTASAVNYVQVTGAATGSTPIISIVGSDSVITGAIQTKGGGSFSFYSQANLTGRQVRIDGSAASVNYLDLYGAIASGAPSVRVSGTDTNIDLALTPKGTGRVQFGTYTATVSTISGFIEIKDAGGTIRRLAVVS